MDQQTYRQNINKPLIIAAFISVFLLLIVIYEMNNKQILIWDCEKIGKTTMCNMTRPTLLRRRI